MKWSPLPQTQRCLWLPVEACHPSFSLSLKLLSRWHLSGITHPTGWPNEGVPLRDLKEMKFNFWDQSRLLKQHWVEINACCDVRIQHIWTKQRHPCESNLKSQWVKLLQWSYIVMFLLLGARLVYSRKQIHKMPLNHAFILCYRVTSHLIWVWTESLDEFIYIAVYMTRAKQT